MVAAGAHAGDESLSQREKPFVEQHVVQQEMGYGVRLCLLLRDPYVGKRFVLLEELFLSRARHSARGTAAQTKRSVVEMTLSPPSSVRLALVDWCQAGCLVYCLARRVGAAT